MVARGNVDMLRMPNRQTVESMESTHQARLINTDSKKRSRYAKICYAKHAGTCARCLAVLAELQVQKRGCSCALAVKHRDMNANQVFVAASMMS